LLTINERQSLSSDSPISILVTINIAITGVHHFYSLMGYCKPDAFWKHAQI